MESLKVKEFAEEIVTSAAEKNLTIEEFRKATYIAKRMVNQSTVEKDSSERSDFLSSMETY